jgi:hypothetical protein
MLYKLLATFLYIHTIICFPLMAVFYTRNGMTNHKLMHLSQVLDLVQGNKLGLNKSNDVGKCSRDRIHLSSYT